MRLARATGLIKRLLADERISFLLVGGINTAFGFGVFIAADYLVGQRVDAAAGATLGSLTTLVISHVCAVTLAFVLYRRFVFKVKGHVWRDLARFESVYLVQITINAVVLPILVHLGFPRIRSQFVILFFTALLSYLGHKFFTFRRPAPAAPYVREAVVEDAATIARVHLSSLSITHPDLPAEVIASLDAQVIEAKWAESIQSTDQRVFVAFDGSDVVGWASTRQHGDSPGEIELEGLYVLGEYHPSGLAQILLEKAVGTAPAFHWAPADNKDALEFYAESGFHVSGELKPDALLGTTVQRVRLAR